MSVQPNILDRMRASYLVARDQAGTDSKSAHWDAFPADYERVFDQADAWDNFLRNALSVGFNDDLTAFCEGGQLGPKDDDGGLWPLRHLHNYRELLPRQLVGATQREHVRSVMQLICAICGPQFVLDNLETKIGSPAVISIGIQGAASESSIETEVNFHDLSLIYYAWQIGRVSKEILSGASLIVEIGGGYGGLAAKLKAQNPKSRIVLFDLPEVNAAQTYYLANRFPAANLLLHTDHLADPKRLNDGQFDIAILPGASIDALEPHSVDLAINIRSMMEMTSGVIDAYFDALHKIVRPGGLFTCINRYDKAGIRIKEYPFDDRWQIRLSQTSPGQNHVHELIVERSTEPQSLSVSTALQSLPPFS